MNPLFGLDLLYYVFEPASEESVIKIKLSIENTINRYLPNITVNDLLVEFKELESKTYIIIELNFSVTNIPEYYDILKLVVGDNINGIV